MRHAGQVEVTTERLTAYLEGEVTPSEAAKIEAEIRESPVTERRLESLRRIRDVLCQSMPEHRDLDLVPSLRQALATPTLRVTPMKSNAWRVSRGWATAAAGGILVIGLSGAYRYLSTDAQERRASSNTAPGPKAEEFRAKSGSSLVARPSRWAGVRVFHATRTRQPEPLKDTVSTEDGLLFSYTNLGNNPFDYLAIFAVDARQNVRWFYPAYDQPGTDPASISIKRGLANVPLPDLIHLDWIPGPIAIHALFSHRPLHVLEVEARIEQAGSPQATRKALDVSDTLDQVTTTELVP
jgi:hypothetical protein